MNKEIEEAAKAYAAMMWDDDICKDMFSKLEYLGHVKQCEHDFKDGATWQSKQPLTVKPVEDERRIKDVLLGLLNYIDVTGSSIKESSIFKDADVFLNTYRPLPAPVKVVEGETITGVDKDAAAEPIQNALYATGRFTAETCCNITDGILDYLKDAEMFIVHKQVKPPVEWLDKSYEPGTKELTGEEMVSKAWTYLAKGGIVTNKEKGDCFPALSVLRALQIAAGVTPNEPNTTRPLF